MGFQKEYFPGSNLNRCNSALITHTASGREQIWRTTNTDDAWPRTAILYSFGKTRSRPTVRGLQIQFIYFHILLEPAHMILTKAYAAYLGILTQLDGHADQYNVAKGFPLAQSSLTK